MYNHFNLMFKLCGVVIVDYQKELNYFLVKVFNEILRIEEDCLRTGEFCNVSVREMHVIEAVSLAEKSGGNRSSDIAQTLGVLAGTLTTSVKLLEKKGCITRKKDSRDRRIVRLYVTEKGKRAYAVHQSFHKKMVDDVLAALSRNEAKILIKGLKSLESFFIKNK